MTINLHQNVIPGGGVRDGCEMAQQAFGVPDKGLVLLAAWVCIMGMCWLTPGSAPDLLQFPLRICCRPQATGPEWPLSLPSPLMQSKSVIFLLEVKKIKDCTYKYLICVGWSPPV